MYAYYRTRMVRGNTRINLTIVSKSQYVMLQVSKQRMQIRREVIIYYCVTQNIF